MRESTEALSERERESRLAHKFNTIISVENLLNAWREFLNGKRKRSDVAKFCLHFTNNIFALHRELKQKTYKHGVYFAFKISDPKQRDIHKASVRDRLLHHAIYRILYPYFDKRFVCDSYSCRKKKGMHKAINRFRKYGRKVSRNDTKTAWILKCDIKKFFASIDHTILKEILAKYILDNDLLWLLDQIIDSFHAGNKSQVGLPLGNLTSQLFINIYMNEFDQFVKHRLKIKYYIRYADDFVIINENKQYLEKQIPKVSKFLGNELKLRLHSNKLSIKTLASGVDFLGWVHFPHQRVLRTTTKRRMFRRLKQKHSEESLASYIGLLRHGNTYKLTQIIEQNKELFFYRKADVWCFPFIMYYMK